eukprot:109551_1
MSFFSESKCTVQANSSQSLRNLFTKVYSKIKTKTDEKEDPDTIDVQSQWRPSIEFILNDEPLVHHLIEFMAKQHAEENVLFLVSVHTLTRNIKHVLKSQQNHATSNAQTPLHQAIDSEIESIYTTYIIPNSTKQINISSRCFKNLMRVYYKEVQLYSLLQKKSIFDACAREIQALLTTSAFYDSNAFQTIARARNMFTNHMLLDSPCSFMDHSSEDVNKYILSSSRYRQRCHEWKIRIKRIKSDSFRQEFGIVSNFDRDIELNDRGICDTPAFGARAVYGYDGRQNSFYYASYNNDNYARCNKNLSEMNILGCYFSEGDVITVSLDLEVGRVKFFVNDQQVRKAISVARNTDYYPIILYSGDCEYEVLPF